MGALANIVLTDGAPTPVAHTFAPTMLKNNVATFEKAGSSPIANKKFTISHTVTSNGRHKVVAKLALPEVVDTVIGSVTTSSTVRTAYAELTLSFDETSTTQERENARQMLCTAFQNNTLIQGVAENLEYLF